jgi:hypothetical protein
MKRCLSHYLLIFLAVLVTGFKSDSGGSEFQSEVQNFLLTYSEQYEIADHTRLKSRCEIPVLESGWPGQWHKRLYLTSKKLFLNRYGQKSYQRFQLGFHEYKSVERCDSAFNAMLLCIGGECTAVKWGEKKRIKTPPIIYIKTDHTILYAKCSCEMANQNWDKLKSDLKQQFETSPSKIMSVGCGGSPEYETL